MPVIVIDETWFAPYDDVASRLVALATGAKVSITVDIYGLTLPVLIDAFIARHAAGAVVRIVADHSQAMGTSERPQLQRIVDAGVELVIGNSAKGGINHSKYLVVDGATVGFGSFNFSTSAASQDNTFSIRSESGLVAEFLANWQRVYADAVGKHPDWQVTPTATGKALPTLEMLARP